MVAATITGWCELPSPAGMGKFGEAVRLDEVCNRPARTKAVTPFASSRSVCAVAQALVAGCPEDEHLRQRGAIASSTAGGRASDT
jgi:hypothetical protein